MGKGHPGTGHGGVGWSPKGPLCVLELCYGRLLSTFFGECVAGASTKVQGKPAGTQCDVTWKMAPRSTA